MTLILSALLRFYGFEALSINQWKNVEEIKCE